MNAPLHDHADRAIAQGSSSFAAASVLFDRRTRLNARLLYAWCRYCDDLIDGQDLGRGRHARPVPAADALGHLERETLRALDGRPNGEPAFRALAEVAANVDLPGRYPLEHIAGFRMDVEGNAYRTLDDLLVYCWRIAGVVGVMMSLVMGRRDPETLDFAADLGIAFQLTNISRDVVEDARAGRVYLPQEWLEEAGLTPARVKDPACRPALAVVVTRLLDAAEPYYASAEIGIGRLPFRSACAVAAAARIYRAIGIEVRRREEAAWDDRVRTSAPRKLGLGLAGIGSVLVNRTGSRAVRNPDLWTRPT